MCSNNLEAITHSKSKKAYLKKEWNKKEKKQPD